MNNHTNRGEKPIRVLIADDHPMVREGVRAMLVTAGITVVGEATTGVDAVKLALELRPDVVLLDVNMPVLDGIQATEQIHAAAPDIAVVIITSYDTKEFVRQAVAVGAAGYLLKGVSRDALVQAVSLVTEGGSLIDSRLLSALTQQTTGGADDGPPRDLTGILSTLTPREIQVLQHLSQGRTNKEIAAEMHYSVGTVKNVVQNIIEKLDVSDRTEAAVVAARAGLDV